jgi:hypothetical protein
MGQSMWLLLGKKKRKSSGDATGTHLQKINGRSTNKYPRPRLLGKYSKKTQANLVRIINIIILI